MLFPRVGPNTSTVIITGKLTETTYSTILRLLDVRGGHNISATIEVRNLVKIFGDNPQKGLTLLHKGLNKQEILEKSGQAVGVAGVSFSVNKGEIFVLMGLSGSGKSTLLRLLNRLIEPTSGEILVDGNDVMEMGQEELRQLRRNKMSMVFQHFGLLPHRTVLDNAAYGLEIRGVPRKERLERARNALSLVGLTEWEDYQPNQLSGGMQQRVGLARALATDSEILLMDEAFSGLDPLIRRDLQDELLRLQEQVNKTIVFVTHDLEEALKVGDRIALLKNGLLAQLGTPEEILTQPADKYVARFVEGVDRSKVLKAERVMIKPDTVAFLKDGPMVALHKMRERGISSIFVINRNRVLQGMVNAEDALLAVERGQTNLEGLLNSDYPAVSPDTPVRQLIPVLADSRVPAAVIDEQEHLLGIIVRGSLLAGLVTENDDQIETQ